jgi:hypothetical protein
MCSITGAVQSAQYLSSLMGGNNQSSTDEALAVHQADQASKVPHVHLPDVHIANNFPSGAIEVRNSSTNTHTINAQLELPDITLNCLCCQQCFGKGPVCYGACDNSEEYNKSICCGCYREDTTTINDRNICCGLYRKASYRSGIVESLLWGLWVVRR